MSCVCTSVATSNCPALVTTVVSATFLLPLGHPNFPLCPLHRGRTRSTGQRVHGQNLELLPEFQWRNVGIVKSLNEPQHALCWIVVRDTENGLVHWVGNIKRNRIGAPGRSRTPLRHVRIGPHRPIELHSRIPAPRRFLEVTKHRVEA